VVRGADNAVWCIEWNDNAWSSWFSLGGVVNFRPAIACPSPAAYCVFAIGTDMALYVSAVAAVGPLGFTNSWTQVGSGASSAPAAVLSNPRAGGLSVALRI